MSYLDGHKPQFAPWEEDPDPPEFSAYGEGYWQEEDWEDLRQRLRAYTKKEGKHHKDALGNWSEEKHPRNEEGEFGSAAANREAKRALNNTRAIAALSKTGKVHGDNEEEAKQFATEKILEDGPREGTSRVRAVKDEYIGWWGSAHSLSKAITSHSSKVMGIEGYEDEIGMNDPGKRLGEKFLDVIAEGRGAGETLYHGFHNTRGIDFKQGDTLKLPLTASTGDIDDAAGYGVHYRRDNADSTVFEFPPNTPMAGYSRWDRNSTKDFGHTWAEAIIAGEFKVVGFGEHTEPGWKRVKVKVVKLEPIGLFDRETGWKKL